MSCSIRSISLKGAAVAASLGCAAILAAAAPAHAEAWIQFGITAPSPPPVIVAPPPAYGYVYSYPYGYAYPETYYTAPVYSYGRYYVRDRDDRHDRRPVGDWDHWHGDDD